MQHFYINAAHTVLPHILKVIVPFFIFSQSIGMAVVLSSFQIGLMVGPAVGGIF